MLDELSIINGYDVLILDRYNNFLEFCSSFSSLDSPEVLKLFNIANLKYLILPQSMCMQSPNLSLVYEGKKTRIWENTEYLPRAYIVHRARVIRDNAEVVLSSMLDDDFEPFNTVILEEDVPVETSLQSAVGVGDEAVSFLKYAHNEVIIQAKLKQDGYLILSDANYPGWRANVLDIATGQRRDVDILYANYIFRGIPLRKGDYIVHFLFKPVSFYAGRIITILTIIIVIIGLMFGYRRKRITK